MGTYCRAAMAKPKKRAAAKKSTPSREGGPVSKNKGDQKKRPIELTEAERKLYPVADKFLRVGVERATARLAAKKAGVDKAKKRLDYGRADVALCELKIATPEVEYYETKIKFLPLLADAKVERGDAQVELDQTQVELADAKRKLATAEAVLTGNGVELEDAKKELEDAEKELEDAEKELEDAEKELAEFEANPTVAARLASQKRRKLVTGPH